MVLVVSQASLYLFFLAEKKIKVWSNSHKDFMLSVQKFLGQIIEKGVGLLNRTSVLCLFLQEDPGQKEQCDFSAHYYQK